MNELEKLTGMVLKQAPIGEFDKRLVLLTREHGKVTVFAKGARRQNSPLLAPTNPFVFGVFFCFRGRDSFRLSQVEAKEYFRSFPWIWSWRCTGSIFWNLPTTILGKQR